MLKRWDGHVAKYLGDGVLAYFGWPKAHEDDAERAARAGLELVAAVGELTADGSALAARICIATGQVVVGDLTGEGAALEQAVVGDTPNLAARLQALAEPGAVVIAPSTRKLLGDLFELNDLGPQHLKGFPEPLGAWQVVAESAAESRFEALRGSRVGPLVGREHEIGLLLDRWERAKEGEGQVVLLSGEPGIGKSRIVRALRESLADQPHMPLSHYCSPHHTNSPLYPLVSLLERAACFAPNDCAEVRLDKLEALLAQGAEMLGEVVPLVAALLEIETGERYAPLALSAQRQKQRTLEVLVDQVEGLAAQQPVLAIYEDAHWIDPTTLEVLGLLIERMQCLPVLVLITFRPEFGPPWTGHAHVMQLSLSRLTRRHGRALIDEVTRGKTLPDDLLDQISDLVAEVVARIGETLGSLWFEAERHRLEGERQLYLLEPDEAAAEASFRRAIEVAREQEAKMWELRGVTNLAALWAQQGQRQNGYDLPRLLRGVVLKSPGLRRALLCQLPTMILRSASAFHRSPHHACDVPLRFPHAHSSPWLDCRRPRCGQRPSRRPVRRLSCHSWLQCKHAWDRASSTSFRGDGQ